ncbi:SAUR-like auxin-responsive protein family [Raphanus sativus]|uniref:Auxin-induced protein 15A n=1 Tax=Raphanus sativus TaxID=3726 RepID=A0A6J0KHF0_RAPSA|nr:auxin-induced protein 15A [Raphanus sativus]KAJ4882344.1 SAUR-like auxin-responsive protein family [Raphanus sativus]
MMKSKLMTKAWKQVSSRVAKHRAAAKEPHIPHDVPKGHLVVYVGKEEESYKRFVIKITLLYDPTIRALLDQSKDEAYDDFTSGYSKLCIPCDETLFLEVLRCASPR